MYLVPPFLGDPLRPRVECPTVEDEDAESAGEEQGMTYQTAISTLRYRISVDYWRMRARYRLAMTMRRSRWRHAGLLSQGEAAEQEAAGAAGAQGLHVLAGGLGQAGAGGAQAAGAAGGGGEGEGEGQGGNIGDAEQIEGA